MLDKTTNKDRVPSVVMEADLSASRPTAWHVGRSGEVAGGMTQVVNGYLGWGFQNMNVRVIHSRDGSKGLAGLFLFLKAFVSVLAMPSGSKNMFIVHLSQGGAFIREGMLLLLTRARGFGVVAHLHGSSFVEFAKKRPWLVGKVLSAATKVIVLSETTRVAVEKFVPASRVVLVPNAVPDGKSVPKEKLIVFGGAVTRRKGVDVLVKAWRDNDCGSGIWRLAIAGPIKDDEVVPTELPGAEFMGSVAHSQLMTLLDRSSIAVLPSRDEAMPMFILEALARDNCVISTRVGGIPAVLANGRGILVDAGDSDQLAAALRRAINDDVFREDVARLGRAGFDDEFSAKTIYPRVERLWLDVLMDPSSKIKL